jgi:hypothetical protein
MSRIRRNGMSDLISPGSLAAASGHQRGGISAHGICYGGYEFPWIARSLSQTPTHFMPMPFCELGDIFAEVA